MSISKQIKKLAGESAIYGVAGIFSRFVNLFLFPFYSKVLPPSEYGIIGMYNSTFLFFFVMVCFGMDSATFRFYFDANNEIRHQKKTFSNWFFFQLFLSLTLCSILLAANNFWSSFFFKGYPKASSITKWLAPVIILYATPTILEVWYRLQRKAVEAVTYSVATTSLSIVVSLFCILKFHLGVLGFIYGQMAGYLLGTIYGLIVLRKWITLKNIDLALLKNMLRYALPLLPAGLASTALLFASNYYLKTKLNFTELGLYSIGNTLASSLGLITMAFGQAWSPFAFSIANTKSAAKTYSAVFTSFCIVLSLACLVFCIFLPDVLKIFTNKNYYGAEIVGCILSFNIFFVSTTIIGMTGCGIAKKTAPYAKAVIIGGLSSLALLIFFGNFWGKEGAALGMLSGQLFIPFYVFSVSQKYYPIPFSFTKVLSIICVAILLTIGSKFFVKNDFTITSALYKTGVVLIFTLFCLYSIKNEIRTVLVNMKNSKQNIAVSKKDVDVYESIVDGKSQITN